MSIRARFDRYDPDLLEGHDLAARGVTLDEQDAAADARREATRRAVFAEHRATQDRLSMRDLFGRPIRYQSTYEDRFGDVQWVDPVRQEHYQ